MKKLIIPIVFLVTLTNSCAQEKFTIAFYNVENLMDTIDNPRALDNDFLPNGKYKWTSIRYNKKINAIAKVIAGIGDSDGPELIGLAEVENKAVLNDLVTAKEIKKYGYAIVHYDSPDERGIDVALLYKKKAFQLLESKRYSAAFLNIKSHTRDVLMVKGKMGKDTIIVFVNHWPSRRIGKEVSEDKRIAIAMMVREKIDSILLKNIKAKILVMGDFNDEPQDKSLNIMLNAKGNKGELKKEELFNPFYSLSMPNQGSVKYSKEWIIFDQVMISYGFLKGNATYEIKEAAIYAPDWLHYKKELNNGPYRTYMGSDYKGGFSDHFPVYIQFEVKY